MKRSEQREVVFISLFEAEFNNFDIESIIENLKDVREISATEFAINTLKSISEKIAELDALIEKFSKGWKAKRLPKVSLAILRLAIYEIKFSDEVPESVAINEAVELAKKYGNDDAPAFINGILGSISRTNDEV